MDVEIHGAHGRLVFDVVRDLCRRVGSARLDDPQPCPVLLAGDVAGFVEIADDIGEAGSRNVRIVQVHSEVGSGQVRVIDRDDRLGFVLAEPEKDISRSTGDDAALWREIGVEKRALATVGARHIGRKDERWDNFRGREVVSRVHAAVAGLEPANADVVCAGGLLVADFDVVLLARLEPEEIGFPSSRLRPAAECGRCGHRGTAERIYFFVVVRNPQLGGVICCDPEAVATRHRSRERATDACTEVVAVIFRGLQIRHQAADVWRRVEQNRGEVGSRNIGPNFTGNLIARGDYVQSQNFTAGAKCIGRRKENRPSPGGIGRAGNEASRRVVCPAGRQVGRPEARRFPARDDLVGVGRAVLNEQHIQRAKNPGWHRREQAGHRDDLFG